MNILYAINNEWFIENEAETLIEKGHNIYIPHMSQIDVNANRAWVTKGKIDKAVVEKLEKYIRPGRTIDREVIDIINANFDIVIMDYNKYLLQAILMFCNISVILQPVAYYTEDILFQKIIDEIGFWAIKAMEKKDGKFHINIYMKKHSRFIKKYYHNVPLPLKKERTRIVREKKVLAIYNEIRTNATANSKLQEYNKEFEDIPHIAVGKQLIPVAGSKDIQTITAESKLSDIVDKFAVLYYDQKADEFPYYVLEALKKGIPVVYTKDGFLDLLFPKGTSGRGKNIEECKKKCARILKDEKFAKKIVDEQYLVVENIEASAKHNKENFIQSEKKQYVWGEKIHKIALIIPDDYHINSMIIYTLSLAEAISKGAQLSGKELEVIVAFPEKSNQDDKQYYGLMEEKIKLRKIEWNNIDCRRSKIIMNSQGYFDLLDIKEYIIANDGISSFEDCECVIYMSDRIPGNVYDSHPHAIFLSEYVQRYNLNMVPTEFFDNFEKYRAENTRSAVVDFITKGSVENDAVQYIGVERAKIQHFPPLYRIKKNNTVITKDTDDKKYFVWNVKMTDYGRYEETLDSLAAYYQKGGTMDCMIIGEEIDCLKKGYQGVMTDYQAKIKEIIGNDKLLKKHIHIKNRISEEKYLKLIGNAWFLLISDDFFSNGQLIFDAAYVGVPTVIYKSELTELGNCEFKIGKLTYTDDEETDQLCDLLNMLENEKERRKVMSNSELEQFTSQNEHLCKQIYELLNNYLPL